MNDEAQVVPLPRPSGSARPRLVLGLGLLIFGLGDVLFMNIVLVPRVLTVEDVSTPRPQVGVLPAEPSPAGAAAGPVAAPATSAVPPVAEALPTPSASAPRPPSPPTPSLARSQPSWAPLLFPRSSAWLSRESRDRLAQVAAFLKADSTLSVRLEGHADDSGPERFNQMLSLKRAANAKTRLQSLGIGQARIDIKGYGSEQPAEAERTNKARARNRRVEITLY